MQHLNSDPAYRLLSIVLPFLPYSLNEGMRGMASFETWGSGDRKTGVAK